MSKLRLFWVWPDSGPVHGEWEARPAVDAFVRSSRRVCELVERALTTRQVDAPHSEVRLFAGASDDERVLVKIVGTLDEGFDSATVLVPDAVRNLSAQERGVLVLEVAELLLSRLAELRGWGNAEQLAGIRDELQNQQLRYIQVGRWTTSPGRDLRARPVAEIADDGLTRVHYEVADAHTAQVRGVTRSTWVMENRRRRLERLFAANTWRGDAAIVMRRDEFHGEGGWREAVGEFEVDTLSTAPAPVDPTEPAQLAPLVDPVPARSGLRVEVVTWWGAGTDEPKVMTGGFTDAAPGDYRDFHAAYFVFATWIKTHCADWWSTAEPNVLSTSLEVSIYHRTGRLVRVTGDTVTAVARRRPEDLHSDRRDRNLAREDLTVLLGRVAKRLHLPAPPELPDATALAAQIEAVAARTIAAHQDEERWLTDDIDELPPSTW